MNREPVRTSSPRRRRIRRRYVVVGLLLLSLVSLAALEQFDAGRTFLVRSFLRSESMGPGTCRSRPGRGWPRKLEPLMARVGVLRPVRVEVEPGVSLLLDPGLMMSHGPS